MMIRKARQKKEVRKSVMFPAELFSQDERWRIRVPEIKQLG